MTTQIQHVYWDAGAHTAFSKKIYPSILHAVNTGMYTTQVFMGNPRSFKRQDICDTDIDKVNKLITRFPMHIFTHFPYIANLAGKSEKGGLAWDGNDIVDDKLIYILKQLSYELGIVARIETKHSGVIIHPGSYVDRDAGHRAVAKSINRISFSPGSKLLLENCAGEGNKLCKTFEEIKMVFDLVEPENHQYIGVCVDTAHVWGQGDYDLSQVSEVDRMFDEFDKIIGLDNFCLLHLNDSKVHFGAKKDEHELLGEGYIWGDSFESLIHLLNLCKLHNIPMVLETEESDMKTLSDLSP